MPNQNHSQMSRNVCPTPFIAMQIEDGKRRAFLELLYFVLLEVATSLFVPVVECDPRHQQMPTERTHPIHLNLRNFSQSSKRRSHGGGGGCSVLFVSLLLVDRSPLFSAPPSGHRTRSGVYCRRTTQCMLLQRQSCCTTCSSRFRRNVS